ncbi:MAG: heat-shock protein [Flavobacteriaceae bacterium]|jgi:HSP20 family protein|nr:heat-shock protein [Flavobacteriaceae bacterium]|tara:strand:+ start:863 stop:1267 length:405 start_codon:yes stop_codon:yes gene_type:complete
MNIIKRTNYPIMFDEFFNDFFNVKPMSVPPHNIMETENDFQIEFSVPGSNKKDFEIEVENDNIKIIKKKEDLDTTNNYSRQEFNYSFFEKSFYLPESIDQSKISSKYDNGILRISLPKKSEVIIQNQRKFITVK